MNELPNTKELTEEQIKQRIAVLELLFGSEPDFEEEDSVIEEINKQDTNYVVVSVNHIGNYKLPVAGSINRPAFQ